MSLEFPVSVAPKSWPAPMASTPDDLQRKTAAPPRSRSLLAGMWIRKKLILLRPIFSLSLAVVLVIALRPKVAAIAWALDQKASAWIALAGF